MKDKIKQSHWKELNISVNVSVRVTGKNQPEGALVLELWCWVPQGFYGGEANPQSQPTVTPFSKTMLEYAVSYWLEGKTPDMPGNTTRESDCQQPGLTTEPKVDAGWKSHDSGDTG